MAVGQTSAPSGQRDAEISPEEAPRSRRSWLWPALEIVTSIGAALLLTWLCTFVDVDPLDRVGQVSGLAAIQLRFGLLALVLVGVLLGAHHWLPASRQHLPRLGCAATAGLATGIIAGGVVVALRGARYGLWAGEGDFVDIFMWLRMWRDGQDTPDHYPPLFGYMLAGWTWLTDSRLPFALKDLQIVGTALSGPATYLAWRLVLRPGWALGIGVLAALPLLEPIKPYREGALMLLVPVLIAFVRKVHRADMLTNRAAVTTGVAFGAGSGLLFLLYSGWFVWLLPGAIAAICLVAPWRSSLSRIAITIGSAGLIFMVVSWVHLRGLLATTGGLADNYMYFDTKIEPAYIAMWRNDRPFDVAGGPWPPLGELGGVGIFTILLTIGLALAVWFGWRRTAVITLICGFAGAWLVRMYLASQMYETQLVRLYPRTTMVLLYLLLLLTGFGVKYGLAFLRERLRQSPEPQSTLVPVALFLVPALFLFASIGSATSNRLMPDNHASSYGFFSWVAHVRLEPDGTCSPYAIRHGGCNQEPLP